MSTVKTTNLQHPSASDVGITLGADGSVVLPQGFTGGIGSNVVQTVKTDTFTTSSATFVTVTGLTVSITPSSDTAKVLVIAQISYSGSANDTGYGHFKVTRAGTDIYVGDAGATRVRAVFGGYSASAQTRNLWSNSIVFLDSPASAASVTYQVETRTAFSGNVSINVDKLSVNNAGTNGASSIMAIEVSG